MKKIAQGVMNVLEIAVLLVNITLSIVVILNVLVFVSSKVFKQETPTLLDYTFITIKENDSVFDIGVGDLVIIDTRKSFGEQDLVWYLDNDRSVIGKVKEFNEQVSKIDNSKEEITISNENIRGTVITNIAKLGSLFDKILTLMGFLWSVGILIITSVIQSLLSKEIKRVKEVKPDFLKQKMY